MGKEIKKRVKESEIEEARTSNKKKTFIITIIILLVIILGLVLFLLYDYKIIFPPKEEETVTSSNTKKTTRHEDKTVSLSVDNSNIVTLFENVHDNISQNGDEYLYTTDKAQVKDMSDEYKFKLAYNIYKKDINKESTIEETTTTISEEKVKQAYETIFGPDTYETVDSIMNGCVKLNYDSLNKNYISDLSGCTDESNIEVYEKIIEVKKNSKNLYITSAVVFNYPDNNICKDIDCNEVLTQNDGDYTRKKHFTDYIEANKDKLQQYTFSFTLGDDGFYYYNGFERTND